MGAFKYVKPVSAAVPPVVFTLTSPDATSSTIAFISVSPNTSKFAIEMPPNEIEVILEKLLPIMFTVSFNFVVVGEKLLINGVGGILA